jgi:hypothetical protein
LSSKLSAGDGVQLYELTEEDLNLDTSETTEVQSEPTPRIKRLLHEYAPAFASKVSYPPPRACCHTIPLILGYRHVNITPYHYAPALKDEIEWQIQEMMEAGLIQHSSSPFSSPVLLVKKKDKSYRLCVDYRHLNAITVKVYFPVIVIDEFLDELPKAC